MPELLDVNETAITGTGFLWIAPKSANPVLPEKLADLSSLDPAFVPVGYTKKDTGFVFDVDLTKTKYYAMQAYFPIDEAITGMEGSLSADMLQITRANVEAAFGGGTWTTLADGDRFDPPLAGGRTTKYVIVSKVIDGDKVRGIVIANASLAADKITRTDKQGEQMSLPLNGAVLADNDVAGGFYELYDMPGTVLLTDEVQSFTLSGSPTGGNWTPTISNIDVPAVLFNSSVAAFQTKVDATTLKNSIKIGGTVGAWTAEGVGPLAGVNIPLSTVVTALTGGTSPAIAVAVVTEGAPE